MERKRDKMVAKLAERGWEDKPARAALDHDLEQALAASTVHWAKPGESAEADLQRASLLHSTGLLHKEAGELSAAEEAWSQAAEIRLGWLGEKHPLSAASQRDLQALREMMGGAE